MVRPFSRHHAVARPIASQAYCENDLSGGGKQADARVLNQILGMARGLGHQDQASIYLKKEIYMGGAKLGWAKKVENCYFVVVPGLGDKLAF